MGRNDKTKSIGTTIKYLPGTEKGLSLMVE